MLDGTQRRNRTLIRWLTATRPTVERPEYWYSRAELNCVLQAENLLYFHYTTGAWFPSKGSNLGLLIQSQMRYLLRYSEMDAQVGIEPT